MPRNEPDTVRDPAVPLSTSPRARLARFALCGGLLLGVLADPLLRVGPWGAGLLIWIAALAGATLALARYAGGELSAESRAWLLVALLSAGTFVWRDADSLLVLADLLAMLAALVMTAVSAAGAPELGIARTRLRDLSRAALLTALETAAGPTRLIRRDAGLDAARRPPAEGRLRRLGRAVLIALPVVAVFALLLMNADPVFDAQLTLPNVDLSEVMPHVIVAGFFGWIVSGWLRGTLIAAPAPARGAGLPAPAAPAVLRLGSVDVTLALGALNALFALFVLVQLEWLFGGEALVRRTTGLGYAEYARHGFFELAAVAALLLGVLLAAQALIPPDDSTAFGRYRSLTLPLVALLGAVMLSAAARMKLYVHYYGLSLDRVYASVFMLWLALVFVWLVLTVVRGRPRRFALGLLASAFAVLALLNVANPDAVVARVNLARADSAPAGAASADFLYLASLRGDAVPVVVSDLAERAEAGAGEPALRSARCAAAASLLARWGEGSRGEADLDWRRWNLARWRAIAAVRAAAPRLRTVCAGVSPLP